MKEVVPIHKAALENLHREHEHDGETKTDSFPKNELVTKPLTLHTPMFLINVFYPTLHRTPAKNRRSSSGGCIFNKSLN